MPPKKQVNLRLDPTLLRHLDQRCQAVGKTRNQWITRAIQHTLDNATPLKQQLPHL